MPAPRFPQADKVTHTVYFFLTAAMAVRAARFGERWSTRRTALTLIASALAYGILDEFHQSFVPGRNPSLIDVLVFDNLGAILGLWAFSYFARRKSTGHSPSSPRPPT